MSSDARPAPSSGSRRRLWAFLLAAVVVLLAAGWAGVSLAAGTTIPAGTTISGVDVGGRSAAEAERAVHDAFAARGAQPVQVTAAGRGARVVPAAAGLTVDAKASVAQVRVTAWNPLRAFRDGPAVEAVVAVDRTALAAAVKGAAATLDRPAVEPTITYAGLTPTAVPGRSGAVVDEQAAAAELSRSWLTATGPVALPTTSRSPQVPDAEAQRVLREVAVPAVAAPVTVVAGGAGTSGRVEVAPATLASAMRFSAQGSTLLTRVDSAVIASALEGRLGAAVRPAKDAAFRIVAGAPKVVPSTPGKDVDRAALGSALSRVIASPAPREVAVPVVDTVPTLTTQQAAALKITDRLSSFTTRYPYAAYRLQNIHRAADLINGTLLKPGEVFSLNTIVGQRTAENGFAVGIIINNGKFAKDFGGGVSQVATTTFNAVFFAGLQDVEHRPHSFWISRYPAGREATVAWGSLDLRFRNDSPNGVLVTATYTSSSVTVSMWGTKRFDVVSASSPRYNVRQPGAVRYDPSPDCVHQGSVAGFDIDVTRVFRQAGAEVRRQTFHTSYDVAQEIQCRAKPAPSPSPTASPAATPSAGAPGAKPTPGAKPAPTPVAPKPAPKPTRKP